MELSAHSTSNDRAPGSNPPLPISEEVLQMARDARKDQGDHEMEMSFCGESGLRQSLDLCEKHPGHTCFTPICSLTKELLPEELRDELVTEFIVLKARETVRLTCSYTSANRPKDYCLGSFAGKGDFRRTGSGRVWSVYEEKLLRDIPCPFDDCTEGEEDESGLGCGREQSGESGERCGESEQSGESGGQSGESGERCGEIVGRCGESGEQSGKTVSKTNMKSKTQNNDQERNIPEADKGDEHLNQQRMGTKPELKRAKYSDDRLADGDSERDSRDSNDTDMKLGVSIGNTIISNEIERNPEPRVKVTIPIQHTHDESPKTTTEAPSSTTEKTSGDGNLVDKTPQPKKKHNVIGYFRVHTAKHVVFDDSEARQTTVEFFYDDPDDTSGVMCARGVRVERSDLNGDYCVLECVTHDPRLVQELIEVREKSLAIWPSSREKIEGSPHAVAVSHPHGCAKQISFGQVTRRIFQSAPGTGQMWYRFTYSCPTCPGSSGAPIWVPGGEGLRAGYAPHSGCVSSGGEGGEKEGEEGRSAVWFYWGLMTTK